MTWEAATNDDEYVKEIPSLKAMQRYLLRKALEAPLTYIVLAKNEIPAAMGLEKRKMVRTSRPMKGSAFALNRKPVPGSKRSMGLTPKGVAVATRLGRGTPTKPAPKNESPLELASRELAESVLAWAQKSRAQSAHRLESKARAVLDTMDDE